MFTSRSEYRLTLRPDNADIRLTGLGIAVGCVSADRERLFLKKFNCLNDTREFLQNNYVNAAQFPKKRGVVSKNGIKRSAMALLGLERVNWHELQTVWPNLTVVPSQVRRQLEIEAHYMGYLKRQGQEIRAFRREEALKFPREFDFSSIESVSKEIRETLVHVRPDTLGAAARLPGITPAAITVLLAHVRRESSVHRESLDDAG